MVESNEKASILMRTICSSCNFSKTRSRTPFLAQRFGAHVDAVPVAKMLGKTAPFAAILGYVEQRIEHGQIAQSYVAALHWQTIFDLSLLLRRDYLLLRFYQK